MHSACRSTGTNSRTSSGIDSAIGNPQIIQTRLGLPPEASTRRPALFHSSPSLLIEFSTMKSPRSRRTGISLGTALLATLSLFAPPIGAVEHTPPPVQPATDFA